MVGPKSSEPKKCPSPGTIYVCVPPSLFFANLSTTALSELWIRPHRLRWFRSWSNDALVGRVLVEEVACMFSGGVFREVEAFVDPPPPALVPGKGVFFRFAFAGFSFGERRLAQLRAST
ncbi:hypothetical protein YC2023_039533 [Brassica napus]